MNVYEWIGLGAGAVLAGAIVAVVVLLVVWRQSPDASSARAGEGALSSALAWGASWWRGGNSAAVEPTRQVLTQLEVARLVNQLCRTAGASPKHILDFLLEQALLRRATDVHLEQMGPDYLVRFRIDGALQDLATITPEMRPRMVVHVKNIARLISYQKGIPQEGRFTFNLAGAQAMEIRASIIPAHGEEAIVLRLFDALKGQLSLDNIGFSPRVHDAFIQILERPHGLILITGPSNSGKTSTIYSSIQYLALGPRKGESIVTLEDPIEFPLTCVRQIEVKPNQDLTFDRLLSNVLRQDVEMIVVGEIRDSPTAEIALRAALTGHLILSTLHCASAAEASRRLVNLGLNPSWVSEALEGVVTQRLARVICPECKTEVPVSDELRQKTQAPASIQTTAHGAGCDHCLGTGFYGRTVIAELLEVTPEIEELIRTDAPAHKMREAMRELGMSDIHDDGMAKVARGITSLEEVWRLLR